MNKDHKIDKELYVKILDTIPPDTKSSELTNPQRSFIQLAIRDLSKFSDLYDETKSELLLSFPQSFLPRIRLELRRIGNDFRSLNQSIADELKRFLISSDLQFRDLEIDTTLFNLYLHPQINIATEFILNPASIQFGLGYFMDSLEYNPQTRESMTVPGYTFGKEPEVHQVHNAFKVNLVKAEDSDQHYPQSDIPAPRDNTLDGLRYSGLPLSPEVLSFFKSHGLTDGQINISFTNMKIRNSFRDQMLLVDRNKYLSRVNPRWSNADNNYIPFMNPTQDPYFGFYNNPELYRVDSGIIYVPSQTARFADKYELKDYNKRLGQSFWGFSFPRIKVREIIVAESSNIENIDFIVLPNHQEFLTALIEIIYLKSEAN